MDGPLVLQFLSHHKVTPRPEPSEASRAYKRPTCQRPVETGCLVHTRYDKQGNVIEKSQGIARTTWIYQYDNANHLVDAQEWSQDPNVSGQPTLMSESQYVYDVFGNLLGTTVSEGGSSTTTRFAYDLNHNIWAQLDGSGTVQTIYVRGDQQNQLLASVSAGDSVSWYLQDHLQSVRGITDASGALVQSINYDAYGNTTSTGFGTFGYAGMQYDAATGMYWTANRVYDPTTGRWYTRIPLGLGAG